MCRLLVPCVGVNPTVALAVSDMLQGKDGIDHWHRCFRLLTLRMSLGNVCRSGFDPDASLATLAMLTSIEVRLEEAITAVAALPQDQVGTQIPSVALPGRCTHFSSGNTNWSTCFIAHL